MRLLLLDDDPHILDILENYLTLAGFQVTATTRGSDALILLKSNIFDVLVTDIVMPEQEGVEIIHTLNRERPDLRIVAMSGGGRHHNYDFLHYAKRMGAHATLQKPFDPEELVKTLKTL